MTPTGKELEVKFYVPDLPAIENRLIALGAQLEQARIHEVNLRFDMPDGALARSFRVLRLRMDTAARMTYKGPGTLQDGVRLRQELEFTVGDFDTAKALLEALGYEVVVMYEKYRAVYRLEGVMVTLDEMPYGNFVEVEGPDGASIRAIAEQIGLGWESRILDSYLMLFDRVRAALSLSCHDLSFANFKGVSVPPFLFLLNTES